MTYISLCCELQRAATQGTTLVLCPRKSMDDKYRNPFQRIWCVEEIRETLSAQQPLVIKCGAAAGPQHNFQEEWDHSVTNELVLSVNVEEAVIDAFATPASLSYRREANCSQIPIASGSASVQYRRRLCSLTVT
jgi:hypothetical protein|eukprot:COSAG02_NODE_1009_length_15234_cov_9.594423_2_plen_134_part_00